MTPLIDKLRSFLEAQKALLSLHISDSGSFKCAEILRAALAAEEGKA